MASSHNIVDEELVLLIRLGSERASKTLFERYIACKEQIGFKLAPDIIKDIPDSEYAAIFTRTLSVSVRTFQLGVGRFINYFMFILKREVVKEYQKRVTMKDALASSISLSKPIGDGTITLEDVTSETSNKVSSRLEVADAIRLMEYFPRRYNKSKEIFELKLLDLSFAEAAKEAGEKYSTASYKYKIFIGLIRYFLKEATDINPESDQFQTAFVEKEAELRKKYMRYEPKRKKTKKVS